MNRHLSPVSLPLDALRAHGCNGEPHMYLLVILEITWSCHFNTNLSVAFLVYSVVRALLACLVCCFAIQSIEHHPLVVLSLPHALFLQPQQVSKQFSLTTNIIFCIVIDLLFDNRGICP